MSLLGFVDCTREELVDRLSKYLSSMAPALGSSHVPVQDLALLAGAIINCIPFVERADQHREPTPPSTEITDWPSQALTIDAEIKRPGEGIGWIQWKGTSVCMDVHCRCGYHVDDSFVYSYECPGCRETFVVGQNVRLYPTRLARMVETAKKPVPEDE